MLNSPKKQSFDVENDVLCLTTNFFLDIIYKSNLGLYIGYKVSPL